MQCKFRNAVRDELLVAILECHSYDELYCSLMDLIGDLEGSWDPSMGEFESEEWPLLRDDDDNDI